MSFTNPLSYSVNASGRGISKTVSPTAASQAKSLEETIADSTTDGEVIFELDVSAVKSFFMVSDQAITVETNNGTTPDDTITLVADVPYVWHAQDYNSFLLGTDVTSLFITNASGEAATLQIEATVDATP